MKKKMLAIVTAALSLASPVVRGASDYLLELDGIKGESQDDTHRDSIEVYSFSWGVENPGTSAAGGGGGGAGKVSFSDLHFTTSVSIASPQLLTACATGKPIPKAVLFMRKSGTSEVYLQLTLENVLVSSYSTGGTRTASTQAGTEGDDLPMETVSLNFSKATISFVGADGITTTGTAEIPLAE
jgi:type VI secretion system secreted protein Hcp